MKYNKCAVLEGLLFVVGDDGLSIEQIMDILSVDKDEAKEIIKNMSIPEKILNEKFSNLSNSDLKILDKVLENFQNYQK